MNIREWTLPLYTILTQLASGTFLILWIIRTLVNIKFGKEEIDRILKIPILIILVTIIIALSGAHLHLSRPGLSFLALRNIQSSWLSRELFFNLLFILCIGLLCVYLWNGNNHYARKTILGWVAICFGFATEYCMARIYLLPSQPVWNSPLTVISFLIASLLLGVMTVPTLLIMELRFSNRELKDNLSKRHVIIQASFLWMSAISLLLVIMTSIVDYAQISSFTFGNISAQTSLGLLLDLYQPLLIFRYSTLFIGMGWLCYTVLTSHFKKKPPEELMMPVFLSCLLVLIAEILGRFLFYAIHVRVGI